MKYIALWFFLIGLAIIVFIQFISGENVNSLLQGNRHLLNEVKIQNDLRNLESDVLTVESDIRGYIITNDSSHANNVNEKIQNIQKVLNVLDNELKTANAKNEVAVLDKLVERKIDFTYQILDTYHSAGKESAEALINTGRGKALRDSINYIIKKLDDVRQAHLNQIVSSIENTGERARVWSFTLAIIAGFSCVLAFLYVVNKGRQQQRMINILNESEKKIKEAAHIKEQFLANMSHEIRTPMNAILGFTNLLKRTDLNQQQVQYVDYIYSSSENLLTIINDILDLSKIEAGMLNIEDAPFSLNGLISSVEIMFRDRARQKGLQFEIDIDQSIHDTLSGDAVRLTQILVNLLNNAVKFTEKGFVQLHIKPFKNDGDTIELQFIVRDSGVGIPENKQVLIFDRFHQADAQTTRLFGGTGLGLSIVKQLVELQNGSIQLVSVIDKGSEFIVILPFKPVYDHSSVHLPSTTEDIIPSLENIKVLVAEDNQMNQQLIKHLMKQWKIDYVLVYNGHQVVNELQKQHFSIVILDIQMPEMDGYAASLAIRNELKLDVPIVAMTAHAMPGEKERCLSYGMNDYISKPIKESELFSILQLYASDRKIEVETSETIIDLDYLKELSMGDLEFENTIIRQFIVQMPEELDLMQEAIQAESMLRIKSLAHGMKSSVSYLGLNEILHPTLHRMEMEAASEVADNHFEEDFERVKTVCEQAVKEARQLLHLTV